jgi:hypothetical protein
MASQIAAEMSKPREALEHWLLIIMLALAHVTWGAIGAEPAIRPVVPCSVSCRASGSL